MGVVRNGSVRNVTDINHVPGTTFKAASFSKSSIFYRPTTMSLAMAKAGIIPDGHLVNETSRAAVLRTPNDTHNIRPSVNVAF